MNLIRRLFLAFALLAAAWPWAAGWAVTPHHVAVIYAADEAWDSLQLPMVLAGIESNPDVVVHRIILEPGINLADASSVGAMKLAVDITSRNLVRLAADTSGRGGIAVIYPESAEPYRSVFAQIIDGIENKARDRVVRFVVGAGASGQDIAAELRRQDVKVVIALGRNGLKTAMALNGDLKIIAGGLVSVPESDSRKMTLLSLAPDPSLLFDRLKSIMPEVRRVSVVYDGRNSGWLIRIAKDAARAAGLELDAYEAADVTTALTRYQAILASADPKRDALWLPQDITTVDDATVLPLVLQESWNRGLAVFSSNLTHVKRGALFSLYPDTNELGRNLATTALENLSGAAAQGQYPLRAVLMAVNLRTANHLGLKFSSRQQQGFDLTFPEP
ncbi:MAG TPA: ABC transporter substrate binding protein [Rhodocyclaceae bacterium]